MLGGVATEGDDVPLPATEELLAEGGLRRDYEYVAARVADLRAAAAWSEKIERLGVRVFLPAFECNERAEINRVARAEVAESKRAELFDRGLGFGNLASLAGGEIGEFQAARVILVFRLVLLVGRTGRRRAGRVEAERELGVEPGDDGLEKRGFFHAVRVK